MTDVTTGQLIDWLHRFQAVIAENQHELTELDSVIGDALICVAADRARRGACRPAG